MADNSEYLYAVNSFPVSEYKVTKRDLRAHGITKPSFIMDVSWPRLVQFYLPASSICQEFRPNFIHVAKEIKHRSFYTPVEFHVVSCLVHRALCEDFEVEGVPHLVAFKAGTTKGKVLLREHDNTIDINHVSDELDILLKTSDEEHRIPRPEHHDIAISKNVHFPQYQQQFDYNDAFLSLYHTLNTNIHQGNKPVSTERRLAFIEWMDLLYWTLPSYWDVHQLITDIRSNMRAVVLSSDNLKEILERHGPPTMAWSESCHGVNDKEEYTCGLWKLFHIISVGVAEQHQRVLGEKSRISMRHIAFVYQYFVQHFVVGEEFQKEFLEKFENCAYDRCSRLEPYRLTSASWQQLALWLWELHNGLSVELLKQRYPDATKKQINWIQWPAPSVCPDCWQSEDLWIEDNIYSYLKQVYWPKDVQNARWVVLDKFHENKTDTNASRVYGIAPLLIFTMCILSVWYFIINKWKFKKSGRYKKEDCCQTGSIAYDLDPKISRQQGSAAVIDSSRIRFVAR